MHFSCKITNSVLNLLEIQGEDLGNFYDLVPIPVELLRDPSYWVTAPEMETLLSLILNMQTKVPTDNLLVRAGHEGPQLRSWGVLDSVLRMMPRPQEVFNNPEQLLSYFISPKPPVDNIKRDENSLSFDLPLPAEQYPLVTSYLKAAFESLPLYIGQPLAKCDWEGIRLSLTWFPEQTSIFAENVGHQVSPALFQSLIEDLQNTQREREDLQKYIGDLEAKVKDYEKQLSTTETAKKDESGRNYDLMKALLPQDRGLGGLSFQSAGPEYSLKQNLARMHDYMVRTQQLITMLGAQGKMNNSVKEAMRRVDWEHVKSQYPQTVFESMELVKKINSSKKDQEGLHHV